MDSSNVSRDNFKKYITYSSDVPESTSVRSVQSQRNNYYPLLKSTATGIMYGCKI